MRRRADHCDAPTAELIAEPRRQIVEGTAAAEHVDEMRRPRRRLVGQRADRQPVEGIVGVGRLERGGDRDRAQPPGVVVAVVGVHARAGVAGRIAGGVIGEGAQRRLEVACELSL